MMQIAGTDKLHFAVLAIALWNNPESGLQSCIVEDTLKELETTRR